MPTVEEIAGNLHMTPRYLSDALKLETGHTALENIHIYQINRAKNLLLGSDDSVATIAYALGFEYPQYFSRLFKNKVGVTPTEYREQTKH
ncbi:helix-turn-helix transcriptional regulator [Aliamphritea spongicola]